MRFEEIYGRFHKGRHFLALSARKPKAPPPDRKSELLLRVIDGELPLRVEVHRPEDIFNVLEVSREFNLRLIIEGGSGAHLLAEKLAEADVTVIRRSDGCLFAGSQRRWRRGGARSGGSP